MCNKFLRDLLMKRVKRPVSPIMFPLFRGNRDKRLENKTCLCYDLMLHTLKYYKFERFENVKSESCGMLIFFLRNFLDAVQFM